MTTTSDRIAELRAKGRRAAVATLVATTGGAIRRLGESMWVDEMGAIVGSVTIGGCVDARALELAEGVLRSGLAQRVSLPLGDEDAWAFGMTCAGHVDLLVEPVDPARSEDAVAAAAAAVAQAVTEGRSALEVVAMSDRPRRMVVLDDGTRLGSLGSYVLDHRVAERAADLIDARASGVISVPDTGGVTDLFACVHAPAPAVVIIGATDVAAALVQLAVPLGFRTIVIDSRERWATNERFPTADELHVGMPSEIIAGIPMTPATALVLVSHDFKYDLPVLETAVRSRAGYIGVLGSRRRAGVVREFLTDTGASADEIARVRIPVGLDIGARTPAEIALSILAELVTLRSTRHGADATGQARDAAPFAPRQGAAVGVPSATGGE
jgi:xanthine dehydrogenase accessory factor